MGKLSTEDTKKYKGKCFGSTVWDRALNQPGQKECHSFCIDPLSCLFKDIANYCRCNKFFCVHELLISKHYAWLKSLHRASTGISSRRMCMCCDQTKVVSGNFQEV